jgi:hypothetical protein
MSGSTGDFFEDHMPDMEPQFEKNDDLSIIFKENVLKDTIVTNLLTKMVEARAEDIDSQSGDVQWSSFKENINNTYTISGELHDEIFNSICKSFGLENFVIYGSMSIKEWSRPSQLHYDGHDAEYSCVIPLQFIKRDSVTIDEDGVYWVSERPADVWDRRKWPPNSTADPAGNTLFRLRLRQKLESGQSIPMAGPGLFISTAENIDKSGKYVIYIHKDNGINPGGMPPSKMGVESINGPTVQQDFANIINMWDEDKTANWPLISHASPKFVRRFPLKRLIPWTIGSCVLFKPSYIHCSTDWVFTGTKKVHLLFGLKYNG